MADWRAVPDCDPMAGNSYKIIDERGCIIAKYIYDKNHAELLASATALEAETKWLGELLAVIHRDGGQYQDLHGSEKAVLDAHQIVANNFDLEAENKRLREALEPFALIAELDISDFEADTDLYHPMGARHALAPLLRVGDLRRARDEIGQPSLPSRQKTD